jgi:DNA-binding FadR family transcriptional regulator
MTPDIDNSNLALDRLRAMLPEAAGREDGRLPTERALAESLGISRRAVRRALEVLEAEGLVWRRQGSGTYVGAPPLESPATADFAEVMEARLRIEPQLAQLAALRADAAAVARLRDILAHLESAADADARELWDSALHREIARAAGNRFFLTVFDAMDQARLDDNWRRIRERARSTANLSVYRAQHRAIVDAIAAHDPVAAGEAMLAHIRALNDNLLRQTSMEALSHAV